MTTNLDVIRYVYTAAFESSDLAGVLAMLEAEVRCINRARCPGEGATADMPRVQGFFMKLAAAVDSTVSTERFEAYVDHPAMLAALR